MGLGSGIRDPGSGKNLFRIPDPGVQKAPDPGSGSATHALNSTSNQCSGSGSGSEQLRIRNEFKVKLLKKIMNFYNFSTKMFNLKILAT